MFDMGEMGKILEGMQGNADKHKNELASKTYSVKTGGSK